MPEMHFLIRWPGGEQARCYSPSLVVRDYLRVGAAYPMSDFVERSRTMLRIASERVKDKYGFHCSAAMDQLVAAKGEAQQARDAATGGTLGPNHQSTIRSTYEHLQSAEREMAGVGRHYGAPGFVLASACNYKGGRALGAGIGGKAAPATPKAPEKETPKAPEKSGEPAEKP